MHTINVFLMLCVVLLSQMINAVLDLNRTPSPEPPESQDPPPTPTVTPNPNRAEIRKLKKNSKAPGVQANAIAIRSGFPPKSKEYKKVYSQAYHRIRKEQRESFFHGKVDNPALALEQERLRKNETMRQAHLARKERKRLGTLTPSDERYYQRCRNWQAKFYKQFPEIKRERNAIASQRRREKLKKQAEEGNSKQSTKKSKSWQTKINLAVDLIYE